MLGALKRMATSSPNIEFLGHRDSTTVASYIAMAKAFVFASREDFGIAPLEAQACGTPVIAYASGGALETVVGPSHPNPTGLFFDTQTSKALVAAVRRFETHSDEFRPEACWRNAQRFSDERFRQEFKATVEGLWEKFQRGEGLS